MGGNANGRSVQLLSELPGLTRLRVGPASDALAASGLCKLPQLELLELDTLDVNFTHLGLLQLAALTGLTILITHPGGDEVQDAATYAGTLTNQVGAQNCGTRVVWFGLFLDTTWHHRLGLRVRLCGAGGCKAGSLDRPVRHAGAFVAHKVVAAHKSYLRG